MRKSTTMRDIAKVLDVSVVTVSKALNDKDGVSDSVREKIKTTALEMGYRMNSSAKSMKEGYSFNIGVVIPERFAGPDQSFYLQFYQKITRVLEVFGYYSILHILSSDDEDQLKLPRIYNEKKVDGFIILGQVSTDFIHLLEGTVTPYVFLDFYTDKADVDCIVTDNFFAVYEITNYLINNGHTKIAFVGNIYSTSSIQDRFLGYYKSLLDHKLILNEQFIISDRDERGKYTDMKLPDEMPTAFVCNCDQVAYNLIGKLKSLGYSVPDDCSVVGFDNDIYATLAEPKLTTIDVDVEEMSRVATQLIIEKIKNTNNKPGRVFVKGNIIHRDSVKSLI